MGIELSGYGGMIALGLLFSGVLAYPLSHRFSLNFYDVLILGAYGVGFGVVGAKIAYLLLNAALIQWDKIFQPVYLAELIRGGFVFYGGIPFGVAGLLLGGRVHHIPVRPYLRDFLPLLPLTHAFGRIGCFLAGCCYGVPWAGPLAVYYAAAPGGAPLGVPLFPVQLVEALGLFAIFGLMLALAIWSKGRRKLFPIYLTLYGTLRFLLEFLRGDEARGIFFGLSTAQWISAAVLCGVGAWTAIDSRP